jgi:hypothetical protein
MAAAKCSLADRYFAVEPRLIGALLAIAGGLTVYLAVFLVQVAATEPPAEPRRLVYPPR